jgi:hypothetical protein
VERPPKPAGVSPVTMAAMPTPIRKLHQRPVTDPDSTLLVLDWDDTLFPTSAMLDDGHMVERRGTIQRVSKTFPPSVQASIDKLQDNVCIFLAAASKHGHVVIVTNAASGWVQQSSTLAAPRCSLRG